MAFEITNGVLKQYIPENSEPKTVTVPEGVTEIGFGAFRRSAIRKIRFPSTLEIIGKEAFRGCSALEHVTIPASVRTIGERAFQKCDALHTVTFEGALPEIRSCAFYDSAHIAEIRFGGKVMPIAPYFAHLEIPVKYSRVFPDSLLTGDLGYAYRDPLFRRMLRDYYEFAHAPSTVEAYRKNAGSILASLGEQHDTQELLYLLRHSELLPDAAVRLVFDSDIVFVRMVLDHFRQTGAPEFAEMIQKHAFTAFLLLAECKEDDRLSYLLEQDTLLTETALRRMLDAAIRAVQKGAPAEYQMLVMRAMDRFSGTEQHPFRL